MPAPDHWGNGWPYAANGAIAASAGTAAPAHWSNGRPFDAGGALAVEYGAAVTHRGRLPFTANGRVAIGDEDDFASHYQGGVPYTSDGRLAVSRGAPAQWVNAIPLAEDGRLALQDYLFSAPMVINLAFAGTTGTTPAYSGTTDNRLVLDHDGVFRRAAAGEPRFWGARRVENFLPKPTLGFGGAWNTPLTGGTGTVECDSAGVVTIRGAPGDTGFRGAAVIASTALRANASGMRWAISCEVRNVWGLEDITNEDDMIDVFNTSNLLPEIRISATDIGPAARGRWVRICELIEPGTDADGSIRFGVGVNNTRTVGPNGLHVEMRNFQLEEVGGASVDCCGEYVDPDVDYIGNGAVTGIRYFDTENGNTVDLATGIVTEAEGDPLAWETLKGVYCEPGASNELSTVALTSWTVQRSTCAASAEVGPDGRLTAYEIDEGTNTGLYHRVYVNCTVTDETARILFHACVKKGDGTDTAAVIGVDNDATSRFYAVVNLDDGTIIASAGANGGTLDSVGVVPLGNGWFWVWVAGQCDTVTDDTSVQPFISTAKDDGTLTYTGESRTIHAAFPMVQDTGAATLVTQAPATFLPVGTSLSADKVIDFGDVSGEVDGGAFSYEASRYELIYNAATHPQNNRYFGLDSAISSGYLSYVNTNNGPDIAFNGTSSTTTGSDTTSDFDELKLRRRMRLSQDDGVACYHGIATSENGEIDATPVDVGGPWSVGNLYAGANVGAPYAVSRLTVWGAPLGQTWAEAEW